MAFLGIWNSACLPLSTPSLSSDWCCYACYWYRVCGIGWWEPCGVSCVW